MKKIITLCCALILTMALSALNITEIPFAFEQNTRLEMPGVKKAVPVDLRLRKTTYNSAEFEWCYNGYYEEGGFVYSIWKKNGESVNRVVGAYLSFSENDYVTYLDNVAFKEYDEYDCYVESHYYISTYWILNCLSGIAKGDDAVWAECVYEVEGSKDSYYALRAGEYYLRIQELTYDGGGNPAVNTNYAQLQFEIVDNVVSDLKAEVSADKKKATITWKEPLLPAGSHLRVSVESGAVVAFDNLNEKTTPEQPLVVNVEEGRTYCVSAQYVTSKNAPLGSLVKTYFTVGTNAYSISNPKAVVTQDDVVEFTWSASKAAAYYNVIVYQGGMKHAEYTATSQKLTKQIQTGTYTWAVAAFEKNTEDGMYYPLTEYVKGNEFTTKTPDLPEGTLELNVFALEAFYMSDYAANGYYPWLVSIATGSESTYGRPNPWIIIWSNKEYALSGKYSAAAGNVEISANVGEGSLMNYTGELSGASTATTASLTLDFDGFDMDYAPMGTYIPYYSGEFKMTCANGKSYYGRFDNLICGAYPYSELFSTHSTLISMWMEEGGQTPDPGQEGIEEVVGFDHTQPIYNVMGQQVDENYKGIIIQGTKKFLNY